METIQQNIFPKIERKLEVTTEKLQEIHKSASKRITSVEDKVSSQDHRHKSD